MLIRICRLVRRVVYTLIHLQIRQVVFRFPFLRRLRFAGVAGRCRDQETSALQVHLRESPISVTWEGVVGYAPDAFVFRFLNVTAPYTTDTWHDPSRGLLWLYHLHYWNWAHSPALDNRQLAWFLEQYTRYGSSAVAGREAYPTSLRIINLVKLAANRPEILSDEAARSQLTAMVQQDLRRLKGNPEYHLLGNHLLENGFGLLWGGFFLRDTAAWAMGRRIVLTQLNEQVIKDGGHYERSPMYHTIILWRLLDTVNLIGGHVFQRHAARMLGWLQQYPWDRTRGHMNDSAPDMTPTRDDLIDYGRRLGITPETVPMGASEFRVLNGPGELQLLIDAGTPRPRYQPGHAHAGTLGVELYRGEDAILIDTGTSTYERCPRRDYERSTRAHNTVSIGSFDSSEVWSAFRVARRARVTIHEDSPSRLEASHDGYRRGFGVTHTRSYDTAGEPIVLTDRLTGPGAKSLSGTATFIAAPGLPVVPMDGSSFAVGTVVLCFSGANRIRMEAVQVAAGFNRLAATTALRVGFSSQLTTSIETSRVSK